MTRIKFFLASIALVLASGIPFSTASAQMQFHYQRGSILNPFSGDYSDTNILTFQHAGGWALGSSFFFIDFLDDATNDGFNDKEFYGEWYPTLSIPRLLSQDFKMGPVVDIAAIGGLNFDGDANILKVLPGLRLSWQIPGFIFVNTDFASIIDYSDGPRRKNGFIFDISWLSVFNLGSQTFSFMGHAEYVSAVDLKVGSLQDSAWILAQPQLVWDIGNVFKTPNEFHVGIEMQIWSNKLGVEGESEFRPQLLVVWQLQ
ncbi:MAG: nucleoside-binding protein [Bacteroidetes bacterium]|nr:nucleoside-binding protein [Bacteroidota bacterium]